MDKTDKKKEFFQAYKKLKSAPMNKSNDSKLTPTHQHSSLDTQQQITQRKAVARGFL